MILEGLEGRTDPGSVHVCVAAQGTEQKLSKVSAFHCPFPQASPVLWKELAKEIRSDPRLLEGFLSQTVSLGVITDHRTRELAFESVYRMWKVSPVRALHP